MHQEAELQLGYHRKDMEVVLLPPNFLGDVRLGLPKVCLLCKEVVFSLLALLVSFVTNKLMRQRKALKLCVSECVAFTQ